MRQNNFNYKAIIWWNIREFFMECWYGVKLLQYQFFDIIALFSNFSPLLFCLFSVMVALGKEWLQIYCLLHFSSNRKMEKKCLHLFKISTMWSCDSWATGRNSQKLGCTCSIVACSCVMWVSTQRSMLAVCLCSYVFCVLWVWKILPWSRPWTIVKLTGFSSQIFSPNTSFWVPNIS